jgi:malate synthase
MTDHVAHGGIRSPVPSDLVRDEIAPGTGIAPDAVWALLDELVRDLGPRAARAR